MGIRYLGKKGKYTLWREEYTGSKRPYKLFKGKYLTGKHIGSYSSIKGINKGLFKVYKKK